MRVAMLLSAAMLSIAAASDTAVQAPSTPPKLSKEDFLALLQRPDASDQILHAAAADQTLQAAPPSLDELQAGVDRLISDRTFAVALFDHLDKDGDGLIDLAAQAQHPLAAGEAIEPRIFFLGTTALGAAFAAAGTGGFFYLMSAGRRAEEIFELSLLPSPVPYAGRRLSDQAVQAAPPSTLPKLSKQAYLAWLATPDAADQILDADTKGVMQWEMQAPSVAEVNGLVSDRKMALALFDRLDADNDGSISSQDLKLLASPKQESVEQRVLISSSIGFFVAAALGTGAITMGAKYLYDGGR